MKAILSAPAMVNGDSNVRVALAEARDLTLSDFVVSGDVLQCQVFGADKDWYVQFCVPEGQMGTFSVGMSSEFVAVPVMVKYDTIRSVALTFGTPRYEGNRVIVPVFTDVEVCGLTKRSFRAVGFTGGTYLYGKDRTYEFVAVPSDSRGQFRLEVARLAMKQTCHVAEWDSTPITVRYPEGA